MKNALIWLAILLVGIGIGFMIENIVRPTHQATVSIVPTPTAIPASVTPTIASNSASLANPASVNCTEKGGTLTVESRGNGAQYELCVFMDNYACEEWAMLKGDCPVNGIKTTGYDTLAEKYCAWLGGKTVADPNATCTFTNGKVCKDTDLYNGKCNP